MGEDKYSLNGNGFASRLFGKLVMVKSLLEHLTHESIISVDLQKHEDNIKKAYEILSKTGTGALHENSNK